MQALTTYPRTALVAGMMTAGIFALTRCVDRARENVQQVRSVKKPPAYADFAGSATCARCHQKIAASHEHTAHFLSTRPATPAYILGSFQAPDNTFSYDSGMVVRMEKRDSGYYQVGYFHGEEKIAKRFDIVVGSGAKGQTYITRSNNRLYQLPVSYFTAAHKWANSPLFPTYPVVFNRSITSRCLECHSTFAARISAPRADPEEFDMQQMIYGVDCEKCHGPGARHAQFQAMNPGETRGKYIIHPDSLSRQQNLDLCALCHGGRLHKTTASFSFTAGEKLSDYFALDTTAPNPENIDVHGNQYGLLRASRCFLESTTLTCNTCHSPHENDRGNTELYSRKCQSCHSGQHDKLCKLASDIGPSINRNCIDCHMPLKASRSITELVAGNSRPTAALIRSHFISIYPEETRKFLDGMTQPKHEYKRHVQRNP